MERERREARLYCPVLETSITADVSYELKVAEDQATAVTAAVQSPDFGSDYANAVNAEVRRCRLNTSG